jgi:hypothetical protein
MIIDYGFGIIDSAKLTKMNNRVKELVFIQFVNFFFTTRIQDLNSSRNVKS